MQLRVALLGVIHRRRGGRGRGCFLAHGEELIARVRDGFFIRKISGRESVSAWKMYRMHIIPENRC
jgi:hypothetical protein